MAFALIKEPYSPAVPRFYRSVYLRPPARTDTGITCPRWSAGNQADATPVAASGAADPASAGVAGRPGFAPGNRRADNVRHFAVAPALYHQTAARRNIAPAVTGQLPTKIHQRAHHRDIGVMEPPAAASVRSAWRPLSPVQHRVEQHRAALLRGVQHVIAEIVAFR